MTINFNEIKAVEITCAGCGSVVTVPLPKDDIAGELKCLGCNTQLWNRMDDEFLATHALVKALSTWQGVKSKRVVLGFSITKAE
jgi:hypothetical protein